MSKRYPKDQWDPAIRMVLDRLDEYPSCMPHVIRSTRSGDRPESVGRWTVHAQIDAGTE